MPIFESNRSRVRRLTGLEIWFFIVGRVLVALGVGALAMAYYPSISSTLAWPAVVIGTVILLLGFRGLRRPPDEPTV